eukprot:TRINITY_DN53059_c0_g1_i1.p1 TRINITY_DN53059_c0_g1~~TRINITY_DN53059_c0_g1_i1.p1  ORF type:complete len:326 (-),score=50.75 TRINITY_DN53059_c0_g1_i1:48-1025(-)
MIARCRTLIHFLSMVHMVSATPISTAGALPKLRVVGAGFGRTGTSSLMLALHHFGYSVYHYSDFARRPKDWDLWAAAVQSGMRANGTWEDGQAPLPAAEETHKLLWSKLTEAGYDTFIDNPASDLWASQLAFDPEAKVILSVRDPESWAQSWLFLKNDPDANLWQMRPFMWFSPFAQLRVVQQMIHWSGCGQTPCGREDDKDQLQRAALRLRERELAVRARVPPQQLLVWDPKDGWEPLCRFLDVRPLLCPNSSVPFPSVNSRQQLEHERVRRNEGRSWQIWIAKALELGWPLLPAFICLKLIQFLWRRHFQVQLPARDGQQKRD